MKTQALIALSLGLGSLHTAALACTAPPPSVWSNATLFPGQALPTGSQFHLIVRGAPLESVVLTAEDGTTTTLEAVDRYDELSQFIADDASFDMVFAPPAELNGTVWTLSSPEDSGVFMDETFTLTFSDAAFPGSVASAASLTSSVTHWEYHNPDNCAEYNYGTEGSSPDPNAFRVELEWSFPGASSAGWIGRIIEQGTHNLAGIAPLTTSASTVRSSYTVADTTTQVCFDAQVLSPTGVVAFSTVKCLDLEKPQEGSPTPDGSDDPVDGACNQGPNGPSSTALESALLLSGLALWRGRRTR